jgi:hypothetical protein
LGFKPLSWRLCRLSAKPARNRRLFPISLSPLFHHVPQDNTPPGGYRSCGITADMAIHLVFEAMSFRRFELPRQVQDSRFMPHTTVIALASASKRV